MKNTVKSLLCLSSLVLLQACGPRGETKTLEQILDGAKSSFAQASRNQIASPDIAKALSDTVSKLDGALIYPPMEMLSSDRP